jgi:hypothetical protein
MLTVAAKRDGAIFFKLVWPGNSQLGLEEREVAVRGLEIGLYAGGLNDGAYNTARRTPVGPDRVIVHRRCLTSKMHCVNNLPHMFRPVAQAFVPVFVC